MKIKRRTLEQLQLWGIRVGVIGIVIGLLYLYLGTTLFTITAYDVQGVDEESMVLVTSQLKDSSTKKVFGIFPGNKIFTYSNTSIVTAIRTIVPDVANVDLRPVGLHLVRVQITLLTPVARLADGNVISENGIVFTTKKDVGSYPLVIIASSTVQQVKIDGLMFNQLAVDGEAVDPLFIHNVLDLSTKVSSVIFHVTNILVESTGDITFSDEKGASKLLFLKDMDSKKVWSTIVSAIDTDPLKSKLANDKDNLEYLDARYGNKVFYRFSDMPFQNGKDTGIIGIHATSTTSTSTTAR